MFSLLLANRFGSLAAFVCFRMQNPCRVASETVAMHSGQAWMAQRNAHAPARARSDGCAHGRAGSRGARAWPGMAAGQSNIAELTNPQKSVYGRMR